MKKVKITKYIWKTANIYNPTQNLKNNYPKIKIIMIKKISTQQQLKIVIIIKDNCQDNQSRI